MGLAFVIVLPWSQRLGLDGWSGSRAWGLVPLFWLALAVPAALVMHHQALKGYWMKGFSTQPTATEDSAEVSAGLDAIWSVLSIGILLTLAACIVTGQPQNAIWPGAVMMMLLLLMKPASAETMTSHES
jgi:hypothetical protein